MRKVRAASPESPSPLLGPPPHFVRFTIHHPCGRAGPEGGARRQAKFSGGEAENQAPPSAGALSTVRPHDTLPPPFPLRDFPKGGQKQELKAKPKAETVLSCRVGQMYRFSPESPSLPAVVLNLPPPRST